jgi:hypothetical protein
MLRSKNEWSCTFTRNTPSWRGAQLKEAQSQLYLTFYYFLYITRLYSVTRIVVHGLEQGLDADYLAAHDFPHTDRVVRTGFQTINNHVGFF